MTQGTAIRTCQLCGGVREGRRWVHRGGQYIAVCGTCIPPPRGAPKKSGPKCQRRCGPGGLVGARCSLLEHSEATACRPAGGNTPLAKILRLQAERRASDAVRGGPVHA